MSQGYFGIIERYFSSLKYSLKNVADPRKAWMTTYPPEVLLWQALFMFQTHIESRRQFERDKATDAFRANLGIMSGNQLEYLAHYGNKGYCLQNYFLVRFIALSIEQFLTFSNGLIKILSPDTILPSREKGISLFGSLKQMAKRLLESLRNDIIETIDLSNVRFSIFSG